MLISIKANKSKAHLKNFLVYFDHFDDSKRTTCQRVLPLVEWSSEDKCTLSGQPRLRQNPGGFWTRLSSSMVKWILKMWWAVSLQLGWQMRWESNCLQGREINRGNVIEHGSRLLGQAKHLNIISSNLIGTYRIKESERDVSIWKWKCFNLILTVPSLAT